MRQVYEFIAKVAPSASTVLLRGESGTGKELVARALYASSLRRDKPFVKVNCAALPTELLESELFGYERGAFTGAIQHKPGKFEFANHGTMFLDEIGDMSFPLQAKLLQVLQDGEFARLGGKHDMRVDVRVIAATNRDLAAMVEERSFREDLFFRLSAFQIAIPPLREQPAEIRDLVRFLLRNGSDSTHRRGREIDAEAESYLLAYPWPGNLRELDNVINRARILSENDCITVADLPASLVNSVTPTMASQALPGASLREQVQSFETEVIHRAIEIAQGDLKLAAQRLGISLSSLYRKLGEHSKAAEHVKLGESAPT